MSAPSSTFGRVDIPAWPWRTGRLDLRPYEDSDLPSLREAMTDPGVVRYLYTDTMTEPELLDDLARKKSRTALQHEGDGLSPAAVLRETGEVVGNGALIWLSDRHRTGEVGFILLPRFQGRGYATEIARELLRVAFEDLGWHRVIGRCDARNTASWQLMERLGMRREAHLRENEWVKGEWTDEFTYAMLDHEWRTRQEAVDRRPHVVADPA